MPNITTSIIQPQFSAYNSTNGSTLWGIGNTRSNVGHGIGVLVRGVYDWFVNKMFRLLNNQTSTTISTSQIQRRDLNKLENEIERIFNSDAQLQTTVQNFFSTLYPFETRDENISKINQKVLEILICHHGILTAMNVVRMSDIENLTRQLDESVHQAKENSYHFCTTKLAGGKALSKSEDLVDLQRAFTHHSKKVVTDCHYTLLTRLYPARLIGALGGIERLFALPVMPAKPDHIGSTGYIDKISVEELVSPVMRGIDVEGRPFLAICYNYKGKKQIEIIHQKTANEFLKWVSTTYDLSPMIQVQKSGITGLITYPEETSTPVYHDDMDFVKQLVSNKAKKRVWKRSEDQLIAEQDKQDETLTLCTL